MPSAVNFVLLDVLHYALHFFASLIALAVEIRGALFQVRRIESVAWRQSMAAHQAPITPGAARSRPEPPGAARSRPVDFGGL